MLEVASTPRKVPLSQLAIEAKASYATIYRMALMGMLGPVVREGTRIFVLVEEAGDGPNDSA